MGSLSVAVNLPFKPEPVDADLDLYADLESDALFKMLPANAKEYVQNSPHLLEYLHTFPVNTYGIPLFLSELTKDVRSMKNPNIIYPVNDTTFVHILPDPDDVRNFYIPIEPSFLHSVSELLPVIETKLIDLIDGLDTDPTTDKERADVIKKMLASVAVIKPVGVNIASLTRTEKQQGAASRLVNFLNTDFTAQDKMKSGKKSRNIPITPAGKIILSHVEYQAIEYLLIRDKIDMGVLKPFLSDPYIEDISCDGVGPIFIEHKVFKGLKSVIEFKVSSELDEFVIKVAERIKRPITYRNPIVDATLPDGSRINIVYGTEISKHGSNFSIRKVNEVPLSVLNIVESNGIDYLAAAYLWICIEYGMSLFVSGETASGKTTLLNAITTFIPPENKIITIEDTPELTVPHRNWIREVALAKGKGEGDGTGGGGVTMFDLLKAALRQRPNQILVGEIRGVEGSVAFGAMQTGHPVMSTFHAASVEKLIQRLCGDPINIPKTYVDNLNLVIIQSAVKRPDGQTVRRMISCNELVGYNAETGGFTFVQMFTWEPVTDTFVWSGKGSSFLLENKIATMLGIPDSRKSEIYLEVEKRAKILERLHKAGYVKFWDLFHMITKIKKQGLLTIGS